MNDFQIAIKSIKTDAVVFLYILFSSKQKFSLKVLLSFCLIFCQFQPGVTKSVAYKEKCVFHMPSGHSL